MSEQVLRRVPTDRSMQNWSIPNSKKEVIANGHFDRLSNWAIDDFFRGTKSYSLFGSPAIHCSSARSTPNARIADSSRDRHLADLAIHWIYHSRDVLNTKELDSKLDQLRRAVSVSNWDGEGAAKVSEKVFEVAKCIINTLPSSFSAPDLFALPTGELVIEWHESPNSEISLIFRDDMIFWSGELPDSGMLRGKFTWQGRIPPFLQNVISQVVHES